MKMAFVDIETTGLDPEKHEILEFAAFLKPENELVYFTLPINISRASTQALDVNKYSERYEELKAHEEHPYDAVQLIHEELKGRLFIGNNPQFDARFIAKLLHGYGLQPSWHYHLVDLKALVAGKLGIAPPWSTADIATWSDCPLRPNDEHTAIADVYWNVAVWESLQLRNAA